MLHICQHFTVTQPTGRHYFVYSINSVTHCVVSMRTGPVIDRTRVIVPPSRPAANIGAWRGDESYVRLSVCLSVRLSPIFIPNAVRGHAASGASRVVSDTLVSWRRVYRVRQNKISQRENRDIYIVQEYFFNEIFHIYSPHTSSQVSLILLT